MARHPSLPLVAALLVAPLGAAAQPAPAGASAEPPGSARELAAAAAASPRPRECLPSGRRARSLERSAWDAARRPLERVYCDALALGYASLPRAPEAALEAAKRADQALSGRAAPAVLEGRAELALGHAVQAFSALARAKKRDSRSLEAPSALHDFAVAALLAGHRAEAVAAYRQLVPRSTLLPDVHRRQRVLTEAALAVMSEGPSGLDEAIGYLSEGRRQRGVPGLGAVVLGSLALALDRQGRTEEARGVVAEAGGPLGPAALAGSPDAAQTIASLPGELHAVAAILVEATHPEIARDQWQAYLESPAGKASPFAERARQKLAALTGTRKKGRPPR